MVSPGGLAPLPGLWLGAQWSPLDRLEVHVWAAVPVSSVGVDVGSEGSIGVRLGGVGASLCYALLSPGGAFFSSAGLGLGTLYASYSGNTPTPSALQPASGTSWLALPHVRVSFGYWVGPHVALRGDALVGMTLLQPVLASLESKPTATQDPAASFGHPMTALALSLEAGL